MSWLIERDLKMKNMFLALCVVGAVVPYAALGPWLWEHGLNVELFVDQMFANPISTALSLDLLLSAGAFLFAVYRFGNLRTGALAMIAGVTLLIGLSAGLPLSGYLWLKGREEA